jgi:hypothetical protein
MTRTLVVALLALASPALAQPTAEELLRSIPPAELAALLERARTPTPDEQAFAKLPQDVQLVLRHLPPREALQKFDYARQNLIAVGMPYPSPERLRGAVEAALGSRYAAVQGASAGTTSFPPLSPLVPATAFEYR